MDSHHRYFYNLRRIAHPERIQNLFRSYPQLTRYTRSATLIVLAVFFSKMASQTSESLALERFFSSQKIEIVEFQNIARGLGLTPAGDEKKTRKIYRSVLGQTPLQDGVFVHNQLPLVLFMTSSQLQSSFQVFSYPYAPLRSEESFQSSDWIQVPLKLDALHQFYLQLSARLLSTRVKQALPQKKYHYEIRY